MSLDTLKTKRNDLLQQRTSALESATKHYESGNMTDYDASMKTVKDFNAEIERINGLIAENEKAYGAVSPSPELIARDMFAGKALVDTIRGTKKYADAWLEAMRGGIAPDKGLHIKSLAPLYEAEDALKTLTIGGGSTPGEDGGFLVPIDFDNKVNELLKDYIDLSQYVTVEHVKVNSGWRVVDTAGTRTALSKLNEMGKITADAKQPSFGRISYNCEKFGDKLIVSNELLSDAPGLISYLAKWWAPKFVMTKNSLILSELKKLTFSALDGATDAEQIKALKHLLNTGLNTAHSRRATILTNADGYDVMDNWVDGNGRAALVPDLKDGGPDKFKARPVVYADSDLIPAVEESSENYDPMFVGDLKSYCTLFLRQGVRIKSTDIGGDAWDTDSTEIRCTCRMDCVQVDKDAVKYTGFKREA